MARFPILAALVALVLPALDPGAISGFCSAATIARPRVVDARAGPDFNASSLERRGPGARFTYFTPGL